MVTEILGKGRGLVAARDIKMGEQILTDEAHIKVYSLGQDTDEDIKSIKEQLNKLPSEARRQFHNLPVVDSGITGDLLIYTKFDKNSGLRRARDESELDCHYLSLNLVLINHSCAPNAAAGRLQPHNEIKDEVRAIKDISRGDEVTMCYMNRPFIFGLNRQQRRDQLKSSFGFVCSCSVCSGKTADQEDVLKKFSALCSSAKNRSLLAVFQNKSMDWQRDARDMEEIVELTNEVYIGNVVDIKMGTLVDAAIVAHLGRDEARLEKALECFHKLGEDTKLEYVNFNYEMFKQDLSRWTAQFKSKKPASKNEVESFYKYWN